MRLDASLDLRVPAVKLLHFQQHPQFFGEPLVIVLIVEGAVIILRQAADGKTGATRTANDRVHTSVRLRCRTYQLSSGWFAGLLGTQFNFVLHLGNEI